MTIWSAVDRHEGPKYLAIADAIERAVAAEELPPRSRLPAQRDLARELGVTVGTVGRGYAEARRRGLLSGEVGRGTFVLQTPDPSSAFGLPHGEAGGLLNLAHNAPHFGGVGATLRRALGSWSADHDLTQVLGYQDHRGTVRHRRAGARWLAQAGVDADPERVVVTNGAQHGMLTAFSAIAEPGDTVLAAAVEYPGMKAVARFLRLQLEGVALDAEGLRPDAFEEACRQHAPRALYCTPTIQNPTATVMPEERRREIAAIAERQGVTLVEDDTYGFLVSDPPPPVTHFAGDRSIYLTSLSKCLAPGLRVGYLVAPPDLLDAIANAMMTTTILTSPVAAELATRMLDDGVATEVQDARRREARARNAMASDVLGAPALVRRGCAPRAPICG